MSLNIIKEGQEGYGFLIENEGYYDRVNKENTRIIKEARNNPNKFLENPVVYCVLQKYGIENRNKRIYPKDVLMNAVDGYMESVKRRSALGSVDHEDSTNISLRGDTVGLLIEDIYWDGATAVGKVYLPITRAFRETGATYNGADHIANYIFEHNIMIGISSRGVGEVKKQNGKTFVSDYDLICWDWVQLPSTIGAWAYKTSDETVKHIQKEQDYTTNGATLNSKFQKLNSFLSKR